MWVFTRKINGKKIYISNENIFKVYDEVLKNNYRWGVRDFDKAISTLKRELYNYNPNETTIKIHDEKLFNYTVKQLKENGFLIGAVNQKIVLRPPYSITCEQIDMLLQILS